VKRHGRPTGPFERPEDNFSRWARADPGLDEL
jgi:hypothetical protein